jgi:DNA/RNA endonuclease YhcR with UshA esterase domain
MNKGILASAVAAALLTGVAVNAHHSLSGVYDIRGSGEVTGTVVKVEFVNPHGAMTIAVDNTDGTKTEWVMTTGSANTLQSLGFGQGGPNTVVAGDVVTIGYFPARNGKPLGFIRSITLPNATTIEFEPE